MSIISKKLCENLHSFIPYYPKMTDRYFIPKLFLFKEFNDLKQLDEIEKFDETYLNHQITIARYLSNWTLYQSLVVIHDTGTGKSGIISATFDYLKKHDENLKMLYITNNKSLSENFKNELFKLSKYVKLKNTDNISFDSEKYILKRNKLLSKIGCEFLTFGTFINNLKKKKTTIRQLVKEWNNQLVVLDEVHNLITFDIDMKELDDTNRDIETLGQESYLKMKQFIHRLKHKKLLLLTATPIKNSINEIAYLLNLALDESNQFEQDTFENDYFKKDMTKTISKLEWKSEELRQEFLQKIKGIVSVLKKNIDIPKVYNGIIPKPLLEFTIIYPCMMSIFQSNGYLKAIQESKQRDFYNSEEQASLFVFPNVSNDFLFGEKGYSKYVTKDSEFNALFIQNTKLTPVRGVSLNNIETIQHILNENLNKLKEFSIIYYQIIKNLLEFRNQKQFIFSDKIKGSGINILHLLLRQFFGYERLKKSSRSPFPRILFLHEINNISDSDISEYLNLFNNTELNKNARLCQAIICTDKTKEGITIKEILHIHICTPHWNLSKINQAIGRNIRYGTHDTLKDDPSLKIDIYLYCSCIHSTLINNPIINNKYLSEIFKDQIGDNERLNIIAKSLNIFQYYNAEIKDYNSKLIEYALLIGSFDCIINKNRNKLCMIKDNTSECFYTKCDYKCIEQSITEDKSIDQNNYNLFYFNENLYEIITKLKLLFKYNNIDNLNHILKKKTFSNYTKKQIINAIQIIIDTPILIPYYDGRLFYLQRFQDILYTSDNKNFTIKNNNFLFLTNYIKYPFFYIDYSMNDIYQFIIKKFNKYIIDEVSDIQRSFRILLKVFDIIPEPLKLFYLSQISNKSLFIEFLNSESLVEIIDLHDLGRFIQEIPLKLKSPNACKFQNFLILPNDDLIYLIQSIDITKKLSSRVSPKKTKSTTHLLTKTDDLPDTYKTFKLLGSGSITDDKIPFLIKDDTDQKSDDKRKITKGINCNTISVSIICKYIFILTQDFENGVLDISDTILTSDVIIKLKNDILALSDLNKIKLILLEYFNTNIKTEIYDFIQINKSFIEQLDDPLKLKQILFIIELYKASSRKYSITIKETGSEIKNFTMKKMVTISRKDLCNIVFKLLQSKNLLIN
jgi:hypothetical protein